MNGFMEKDERGTAGFPFQIYRAFAKGSAFSTFVIVMTGTKP